jgi:hypothetical protein
MSRWLRFVIAGFVVNAVGAFLLLFFPKPGSRLVAVFFPMFWLISKIAGATASPFAFALLVFASALLNIALYAALLFLIFRLWNYARARKSLLSGKSGRAGRFSLCARWIGALCSWM